MSSFVLSCEVVQSGKLRARPGVAHRNGSHHHSLARADSNACLAVAPAEVMYVAHLAGFPMGARGRQQDRDAMSAPGLPRSCVDASLPSVGQRIAPRFHASADHEATQLVYGTVASWLRNHGENLWLRTGLAPGEGRGVGETTEGRYSVTLYQRSSAPLPSIGRG